MCNPWQMLPWATRIPYFLHKVSQIIFHLIIKQIIMFSNMSRDNISFSSYPVANWLLVWTLLLSDYKVPTKWKIIAAYLKGFPKKIRMASFFTFWNIFFCFRDINVFGVMQIRKVMMSWGLNGKILIK